MTKRTSQSSSDQYADAVRDLHLRFSPEDRLLNRELSWLDFNNRVLEEALDPTVPLLERAKFLAIFASNLDEFFMVRVAFVRRQMEAGITRKSADGLRPVEVMDQIMHRVHEAHENIGRCLRESILPALEASGVHIVSDLNARESQRMFAVEYFRTALRGLMKPLVLDVSHPYLTPDESTKREGRGFPQLENGALYFCAEFHTERNEGKPKSSKLVLLRVPTQAVGRFFRLPSGEGTVSVMMIDDSIRFALPEIFPGERILGCYEVKLVRDSDLELDEVGSADLLKSLLEGLQRRKKGAATRFLYDPAMPSHILEKLMKLLKLGRRQTFPGARYHSFSDMMQLPAIVERSDLSYDPMPPLPIRDLESAPSILGAIQSRDFLLHHPYQSFSYVIRFLEEAARDPATTAIKATLYRVSSDSHVAQALARAAHNGKHVTVLVELKARFDEERNITWARTLEQAGVHVIYGVQGLKTHCKVLLVERREGESVQRFCHLGTGNYNDRTARMYSDLGLFTSHPGVTKDVVKLFNRITGEKEAKKFDHLLVAPEFLREGFVARIRREASHARAGLPSGIVAKMNSLVDPGMIDELYIASQAGVPVRLIVRGICCLRPGVSGLSDNIQVLSIVDRFLEHARIYRFENRGAPEIYLSSADWMPRNLNSRIELAFPVLDSTLKTQIDNIITVQITDTVKARVLHADGTNHRQTGERFRRSQFEFYEIARDESARGV